MTLLLVWERFVTYLYCHIGSWTKGTRQNIILVDFLPILQTRIPPFFSSADHIYTSTCETDRNSCSCLFADDEVQSGFYSICSLLKLTILFRVQIVISLLLGLHESQSDKIVDACLSRPNGMKLRHGHDCLLNDRRIIFFV